jgi:hypothetical protein
LNSLSGSCEGSDKYSLKSFGTFAGDVSVALSHHPSRSIVVPAFQATAPTTGILTSTNTCDSSGNFTTAYEYSGLSSGCDRVATHFGERSTGAVTFGENFTVKYACKSLNEVNTGAGEQTDFISMDTEPTFRLCPRGGRDVLHCVQPQTGSSS